MPEIHIITDSCASFVNYNLLRHYPVTIIPNIITIDGKSYRDGIDISNEEALERIAHSGQPPRITPPSVEDFVAVYARAAQTADAIISIHASRELFPIWDNARVAGQQMIGHCQLHVIDSRTLCAGQGLLVQAAARAISSVLMNDETPPSGDEESTLDAIIEMARSAVDRLYAIYYVESLDFLLVNGVFSRPQAMLGTMMGIKPFITIEDGELVVIEKVKTRGQAADRLVDFASEFVELEDSVIVQNKLYGTDHTRSLQDRLSSAFPGIGFPHTVYSPALASLIGTDATGVIVLEKETEVFRDYEYED